MSTQATISRKRKLSIISEEHVDQSLIKAEPVTPALDTTPSNPTTRYGVYIHNLTNETSEPQLIAVGLDFDSAHFQLRSHASDTIDENAAWGATKTVTSDTLYNIVDASETTRLRYTVAPVRLVPSNGAPRWEAEAPLPAQSLLAIHNPPMHYALYLTTHPSLDPKPLFLGGFTNPGDANHAMKVAALAHLPSHRVSILGHDTLDLCSPDGALSHQYSIQTGLLVDRHFTQENTWIANLLDSPPPAPVTSSCRLPDVVAVATTARPEGPRAAKRSRTTTPKPTPKKKVIQRAKSATPAMPHSHFTRARSASLARGVASRGASVSSVGVAAEGAADDSAAVEEVVVVEKKEEEEEQEKEEWCVCRRPDDGQLMVCCENEHCAIQWFHAACVGLSGAAAKEGRWWCEMCREAGLGRRGVARRVVKGRGVKK